MAEQTCALVRVFTKYESDRRHNAKWARIGMALVWVGIAAGFAVLILALCIKSGSSSEIRVGTSFCFAAAGVALLSLVGSLVAFGQRR